MPGEGQAGGGARRSRRVMPDRQRDLRLPAFECPRGMRRPLSPAADIPSRTSVAAKYANRDLTRRSNNIGICALMISRV
jgi:hypothetical protein